MLGKPSGAAGPCSVCDKPLGRSLIVCRRTCPLSSTCLSRLKVVTFLSFTKLSSRYSKMHAVADLFKIVHKSALPHVLASIAQPCSCFCKAFSRIKQNVFGTISTRVILVTVVTLLFSFILMPRNRIRRHNKPTSFPEHSAFMRRRIGALLLLSWGRCSLSISRSVRQRNCEEKIPCALGAAHPSACSFIRSSVIKCNLPRLSSYQGQFQNGEKKKKSWRTGQGR